VHASSENQIESAADLPVARVTGCSVGAEGDHGLPEPEGIAVNSIVKALFSPPMFPGDEDKTTTASMVHYGIMFGLLANFLNIPALILARDPPGRILTTSALLIFALLLNLHFLRRGHVRGASGIFLALAWLALALVNYTAGGVMAPGFSIHIVFIICTGFIFGKQWAFLAAALSTLLGALFLSLGNRGLLPPPQVQNTPERYWLIIAANFFIIAAILTLMVSRLRRSVAAGRAELLVRQDTERELARHQATLEETIRKRTEKLEQANAALKQSEAELQRRAQELEEANRLKDLFADIVSHDLMNPAAAARYFLESLREKDVDPEHRKAIDAIGRSLEKLSSMIQNASAYSKFKETPEIAMEIADLGEIVRCVVAELEPRLCEAGMSVELPAPGRYPAAVNPIFANVVTNIVGNAIKYAAAGRRLAIGIADAGGEWVLSVTDWGKGIADAHKSSVFTRFERLGKHEVSGSGLGLAISKRLVELHGGTIRVEDNPEGGCVFLASVRKAGGGGDGA
jgi:signal transduction histidine kinase